MPMQTTHVVRGLAGAPRHDKHQLITTADYPSLHTPDLSTTLPASVPRTSPVRPPVPCHGPRGVAGAGGALPLPLESRGHLRGYLGH